MKIGLLAALVVAAIFAQVAYDFWRGYQRQLQTAERNAANLVHLLDEQTARTFQAVDLTLRAAAEAAGRVPTDDPDYQAKVHDVLVGFLPQVPFVRAIFIVGADGIMRHLSNALPSPPLDHRERDYFRALSAGESHGLYVGVPILSRVTGLWFVSASLRLNDGQGRFAGLISAAVEPDYFQSLYRSLDVGEEGEIAMYLDDGTLLMRAPRDDALLGKSFAGRALFERYLPAATHGVFHVPAAQGEAGRIVGYRRLENLPIIVAVSLSEGEVLADWRSNLLLYVPILGLFLVTVASLTWFLLRELSQREALAAALRDNRDRLRLALESSDTGTWTWDKATDRSVGDENVLRIFGVSSEEYPGTGESFLASLHADDRAAVRRAIERSMNDGAPYDVVYRIHRPDGAMRWIHSRGEAVRGAKGEMTGLIGVCNDVTAYRQAQDALMQSQRLEVVSRLTGGLAHDFNNLLQVLLGNAEILMDGLSENPRLRRWAEMSKIAAERGAELTRRLMAFARRQMLEPAEVDVNALLIGMSDSLRHILGERHLTLDLTEDLWPATVDAAQLESAVANAAINARDAMPAAGHFLVTTANRELSHEDCIYEDELTPGRYVLVSLADDGVGMSTEVLKRCCEPFYTTKGIGAGSGLGLSMIYGFLKQSDGHLTIASAPGKGTTLNFYLPWAGAARRVAEPAGPMRSRALPNGDETVLVVEDDPLVRRYVCQQIADLGYAVVECADAAAALDVLRRGERIDLLFSDILMPGGMDGIALAAEARRLCPDLRVLLTTGDAQGSTERAVDLAGEEMLAKPYRREDLADALRTVLEGSRAGGSS